MRFLVIDDHPLVRGGLELLLRHAFTGAEVVGAADAREAMTHIVRGPWDVVFLDIDLPDRSGLDLIHDLRAVAPTSPVLIVSGLLEERFGERALQAGAAGFLNKATSADELLVAIRRVRSGKKYVSPDLATRLLEKRADPGSEPPHAALSVREFEVLRLLGDGRTVSEIAARLNLSVKTVSTYRTRVLEKLDLVTTADLIRYTLRHGLEK